MFVDEARSKDTKKKVKTKVTKKEIKVIDLKNATTTKIA